MSTVYGWPAKRLYTQYAALLTQVGTEDPTVKVLNNTTGLTIEWERVNTGTYKGVLSADILEDDKMVTIVGNIKDSTKVNSGYNAEDEIFVNTKDNSNTNQDNLLYQTYLELRLYN